MDNQLRILFFGAHPDDADDFCGGIAQLYAKAGARFQFVALNNGDKGHQSMKPAALAKRRYAEAQASAKLLGAEKYIVCNHHDCELEADLPTRREVTKIIRDFAPQIIFAPRTNDYHPDHRAVGQLLMDVSYIYNVPHWCPDVKIKAPPPVIYFIRDPFTFPREIRPDVIVPVDAQMMDKCLSALACHESQLFEWLVFDRHLEKDLPPPSDTEGRKEFIRKFWIDGTKGFDTKRFHKQIVKGFGKTAARKIHYVEVYELSEYGAQPTKEDMKFLFPFPCFLEKTWLKHGRF